MTDRRRLEPIPPGEILVEEFLRPMDISQSRLSRDTGVAYRRINEICGGKRRITLDTALRLARFFGTSTELWLGLQTEYDLRAVPDEQLEAVEREVRPADLPRPA